MPRYAARRVLLAPLEDVWAFLAEPYHLADWLPGVSGVEPDRRGLSPGARWKVIGPDRPSFFRRPQAAGTLLVLSTSFRSAGSRSSSPATGSTRRSSWSPSRRTARA